MRGESVREIKFRAIKDDGHCSWAYGYLHDVGKRAVIYVPEETTYYACLKETVGQFTGLKDKNDVEIYEGDIIDHCAAFGYVIFEDGMFSLSSSAKVNFGYRQPLCYIDLSNCEVIGNIYDNPDLLEGGTS